MKVERVLSVEHEFYLFFSSNTDTNDAQSGVSNELSTKMFLTRRMREKKKEFTLP